MKLITSALLFLAYCYAEEIADYRLDLDLPACTPRECTTRGTVCETCSSLAACVENPDGTFNKTVVGTCTAPVYCVNGACTSDYDPYCWGISEWPFQCQTFGIFPDPFYRTKFVLCVKDGASLQAYLIECEDGFRFNVANDLCSVKETNGRCPNEPYPVPLCTTAGQTGSIPEKPAMYYICEQRTVSGKTALYPVLNLCSGDQEYVDYQCTSTKTTIPTSTTFTTTPTTTTFTTTPTTTTITTTPTTIITTTPTTTTTNLKVN